MPQRTLIGVVFIALCALAAGFFQANRSDAGLPDELRLGVLPNVNRDSINQRYDALITYLSDELEVPCRLVPANSYEQLVEFFHNGDVDLAYLGGATLIQVLDRDNGVPLVSRDVDAMFSSFYLIRQDSGIDSFAELEGKTFSFGSKLSTSGHYMPRIFMEQDNIVPEDFFGDITYSGAHDATALAVQHGKVFAGVASAEIVEEMLEDGRLDDSAIQVIRESRPYVNYAWTIQPNFDEETRKRISRAFLDLLPSDEEHAAVLDEARADYFVPAIVEQYTSGEEYRAIRELMAAADLEDTQSPW